MGLWVIVMIRRTFFVAAILNVLYGIEASFSEISAFLSMSFVITMKNGKTSKMSHGMALLVLVKGKLGSGWKAEGEAYL